MAKRITVGTKQLALNIEEAIRDRLTARIAAEQRTLRAVVERALTYYMDNVPADGMAEATKAADDDKPAKRPKGGK